MILHSYDSAPTALRAAIDRGRKLLLSDESLTCWIAGGALRRFFARERQASDIDLFFPGEGERVVVQASLIAQGFSVSFENENVLRMTKERIAFDLVKKYFPDPEATIEAFDFTVACCAVTRARIVHHDDFFIDLAARRLRINALPFPVSTLYRLQKYIRNGYAMCPDTVRAIAAALGTTVPDSVSAEVEGTASFVAGFRGID